MTLKDTKLNDLEVVFLDMGSDKDVAIAVGNKRGPGGARHHYAVLTQDGKKVLAEIDFQKGPIQENGVNGVQNEQLLAIVVDRLIGFQSGDFACGANQEALMHVMGALTCLTLRTELRKARGVEGKSEA